MHGKKKVKPKKAYVLIYVLIIGTMSMLLTLMGSKIIMDKKENLYYFERYVLKENFSRSYMEYNLTYLTDYIYQNIKPMDNVTIKEYFSKLGDKKITSYKESHIKYMVDKDCFSLLYYYDENIIREDDFIYSVQQGRIKYSYINTLYINGVYIKD